LSPIFQMKERKDNGDINTNIKLRSPNDMVVKLENGSTIIRRPLLDFSVVQSPLVDPKQPSLNDTTTKIARKHQPKAAPVQKAPLAKNQPKRMVGLPPEQARSFLDDPERFGTGDEEANDMNVWLYVSRHNLWKYYGRDIHN